MKTDKEHFVNKIRETYKKSKKVELELFYETSYSPLLEFFRSKRDEFDITAFYQALLMVYGWMPTIPFSKELKSKDGVESDKNSMTKFMVMTESIAIDLGKAYDHTRSVIFSLVELNSISKYTNNSIVGLSKMLHFMNPDVYPIWDSNIARVFGFRWHSQVKNPQNYIHYTLAMHDIANQTETLRDIEKQLFLRGRELKEMKSID